jgi:hypothetical protein
MKDLNENVFIFDNIIDEEHQTILLDYMENNYKNWAYRANSVVNYENTHKFGKEFSFPGYTHNIEQIKDPKLIIKKEILNIVKLIEQNTLSKLELQSQYKFTYRYKLTCLPPIGETTFNELCKNIHFDTERLHLVFLYYVNDVDGDTLLFNNKRGNNVQSNLETMDETITGDISNVELTHRISPKKGRVIVFNSNLLHTPGWPTIKNRYVVNYNIILKDFVKETFI